MKNLSEKQLMNEGRVAYSENNKNPYEENTVEHFIFQKGYYAAMGGRDRQCGAEQMVFSSDEKQLMYDLGWSAPDIYWKG
jgi:hypothetical protein